MTFKRGIPILAATAACTLGVAVPAASAATDVQQASSENWAGYVVGGSGSSNQQFKSVSGSWVAPTAKCTSGQGYSSFWVGLGGASGGSDSSSASADSGSWSDPSTGMGSGSDSGSGSSSSSDTSLEQAGTEGARHPHRSPA